LNGIVVVVSKQKNLLPKLVAFVARQEEGEMGHSTTWEDGGMVGVSCNGKSTDLLLDIDGKPDGTCPECGVLIRLYWKVWLEELTK
jgi:hypothetical protein